MSDSIDTRRSRKGIFTGLLIVAAGTLWLINSMGYYTPSWIFNWPMIPLLIGVFSGLNDGFRRPVTWILTGIGIAFTIGDVFMIPFSIVEYFWPLMVIFIGLVILIRPKRETVLKDVETTSSYVDSDEYLKGDLLDGLSLFNGTKKSILSKNFRGGETVTIFGGTEINLLQADFSKPIKIDVVVVFGGLKLIVPPNWDVRIEATNILAGVDDKRSSSIQVIPENKILVITGIVVFGGIDIVTY